jgi:hypothetical protein
MGPEECVQAWALDSELMTKAVRETGVLEKIAAQKK